VTTEPPILHHPHAEPAPVVAVEDLAPGTCRIRHRHDGQLPPQAVLALVGARRVLVTQIPAVVTPLLGMTIASASPSTAGVSRRLVGGIGNGLASLTGTGRR
jgi:hypothetical protein